MEIDHSSGQDHSCHCHHESDCDCQHNHDTCQCHHCQHDHLDHLTYHHGLDFVLEAEIDRSVTKVWQAMIHPATWFEGLDFLDPRPGGSLSIKGTGGEAENYMIMDFEPNHCLSFSWLNQTMVSFQLFEAEAEISHLTFHYWLSEIGDQSIQDILSWIIGLKRLDAQLHNQVFEISQGEINRLIIQIEKLLLQQGQMDL